MSRARGATPDAARPPTERPFARLGGHGHPQIFLYQADALDALGQLRRSASVVVTSPPYNRGVRYSRYDDRRPREEYLAWTGRLAEAVDSALDRDGSFFLNLGASPKDPWLPWDVARQVGRRFVLQNVLHWVKSITIGREAAGRAAGLSRDLAVGHYKPLVSERFVHNAHEYIFHFTRRGDVRLDRLALGVPYQDASNIGRWRRPSSTVRCRGNTWFLPYATIRSRARDRPHPASFPPELPEWCIRLHGRSRSTLVVDPFVGIGSSGVAAARLGMGFAGFDVDPEYLRVAESRIRSELAGTPLSSNGRPARRRGTRERTSPSSASA